GGSGAATEAIARDGACRANTEQGGKDGGGHPHHQAVPCGVEKRRRAGQFLIPFPCEAGEWEFRHSRRVDRENRQEDHRQIEEDEIKECVDRQPAREKTVHRTRLPACLMMKTIASAIMVTTVIVTTESAAPSGQF